MSEPRTPESNRRTVVNQEPEAAVAFTSRTDGSRHRFRFLQLEEQLGMWRLHEIKENREWHVVDCEPVQKLRVGQNEPDPRYREQHFIK